MRQILMCSLVAGLLTACVSNPPAPTASASLQARSGSAVAGSVTFSDVGGNVQVQAQVTGLQPGEHGFHIHEVGDCSAADGSSAKGHFNPFGSQHGHHAKEMRHAGDMPNLAADAAGRAKLVFDIKGLAVKDVIGRSVIVHADPDDYVSQPAGNSGKRIACGVIGKI